MRANWLETHYGSRRGFVATRWHQLLYRLGQYRKEDIPWLSIERLVFVCKGNICRSAFAEAVARSSGIPSISVGVHAIENEPANEQAIITAKKMGYDLSGHLTTPITYPILKETDLLVAMEPWQKQMVADDLAGSYHTTLLGLWGKTVTPYIHDPFGQSNAYFENCFKSIERAVFSLADNLKKAV